MGRNIELGYKYKNKSYRRPSYYHKSEMAFTADMKNLYRKSYQRGATLGIYRLRTGRYMSRIFKERGRDPYASENHETKYYEPNTSLKKIITESSARLKEIGNKNKAWNDKMWQNELAFRKRMKELGKDIHKKYSVGFDIGKK